MHCTQVREFAPWSGPGIFLTGAGNLARAGREFIVGTGNASGSNWFHEIDLSAPDFTQMPASDGAATRILAPQRPLWQVPARLGAAGLSARGALLP
jgi:hypothetical protein